MKKIVSYTPIKPGETPEKYNLHNESKETLDENILEEEKRLEIMPAKSAGGYYWEFITRQNKKYII